MAADVAVVTDFTPAVTVERVFWAASCLWRKGTAGKHFAARAIPIYIKIIWVSFKTLQRKTFCSSKKSPTSITTSDVVMWSLLFDALQLLELPLLTCLIFHLKLWCKTFWNNTFFTYIFFAFRIFLASMDWGSRHFLLLSFRITLW